MSVSPCEWQVHDLEMLLVASRKQGVPMLIGSSGDTGSNSRVDMYVDIIKKLAEKHNMPKFKLGYFYSEVPVEHIVKKLKEGVEIEGLDGRPNLTVEEAEATDRIVAVAGIHPFMKLLDMGADVIIGGRSSDCAIFAARALEPVKNVQPHEMCIVVEGIAPTKEEAEEVAMIGSRQLFYARLPEVKGTAGTAAFILDEVFPASPAYKWTLNHVIPVDDPTEFFQVHIVEAGV